MSSAICFHLDQSKILLSGNGLIKNPEFQGPIWILLFLKTLLISGENNKFLHFPLFLHFSDNYLNSTILNLMSIPLPHNETFWRLLETSLLKTLWEKEKLLIMSNFSFTHSVFYQFRELSAIYIKFKIVVCKLVQFWPVSNSGYSN